jgi:hypothetical protein
MLTTVKGVYKGGKVELLESPPAVETAPVMVTFLEPEQPVSKREGKMMTFGMFKGLGMSTEEDFKDAEFDEKKALEKWERANGSVTTPRRSAPA